MDHETAHLITGNLQWVTYGSPGNELKVLFLESHPTMLKSTFRLKIPRGSLRLSISTTSTPEMLIQQIVRMLYKMAIYTLFSVVRVKMKRSSARWRTPITDRERAIMLISWQ